MTLASAKASAVALAYDNLRATLGKISKRKLVSF